MTTREQDSFVNEFLAVVREFKIVCVDFPETCVGCEYFHKSCRGDFGTRWDGVNYHTVEAKLTAMKKGWHVNKREQVLEFIRQNPGLTEETVDAAAYGKLDVRFENNINPISNELHEMVLNLVHAGKIHIDESGCFVLGPRESVNHQTLVKGWNLALDGIAPTVEYLKSHFEPDVRFTGAFEKILSLIRDQRERGPPLV